MSSKLRDLPVITDPSVADTALAPAEAASPESLTQRDAVILPDEAPFDRIAWQDGCEAFHDGMTWEQMWLVDEFWPDAGEPPDMMLSYRKGYVMGYLAAQHAVGMRG